MGEAYYYIFCSVCGLKARNLDAVRNEEKRWVCKAHVLVDPFERDIHKPTITPIHPEIRRGRTTPVFKDSALTWEKIGDVWETIGTAWEEL